ncbi:MAG: hypothetical protein DRN05_04845 [Thermoplasmata archaeon]|nr:MAG: hypothetical protein DRN05_04845 [Thermoplasmata archaeon]
MAVDEKVFIRACKEIGGEPYILEDRMECEDSEQTRQLLYDKKHNTFSDMRWTMRGKVAMYMVKDVDTILADDDTMIVKSGDLSLLYGKVFDLVSFIRK